MRTMTRRMRYFKGAKRLVKQAERQLNVANGVPIRWHVAEPRMVAILKKLFADAGIKGLTWSTRHRCPTERS